MFMKFISIITAVDSDHFVSSGMASGHTASDVFVPSKTWIMIKRNFFIFAEFLESSPLRTNVY